MKSRTIILAFLLLGLTTVFTGCKKDEPTATTGGLVVKVQLEGLTGFEHEVGVSIYTSYENWNNDVYLQYLFTDANLQADFGQLNPGNYYYVCVYDNEMGTDERVVDGEQVQIVAGTDLELTVTLE